VAENCAKYLSKGRGIIVEGRLKQDRWEKDGKTQSKVKISANNVHFLPAKKDDASGGTTVVAETPATEQSSEAAAAWDE